MATPGEIRTAVLQNMADRLAGGGLLRYTLGGDEFDMLSFKELLQAYSDLADADISEETGGVRVSLASFRPT